MTGTKLSDPSIPDATTVTRSDKVCVINSGVSKRANVGQLLAAGGPIDLAAFGAVDDGVVTDPYGAGHAVVSGTDNSKALADFGVWARAQSAAGRAVHVFNRGTGTGIYLFNGDKCFGWTWNIRKLIFGGGVWQNTFTTGMIGGWAWPTNTAPFEDHVGALKRWVIASTNVGDTQVTFLTPADAANFSVGDPAMVGSLDIQNNGFPMNMGYHDFFFFKTISATTGICLIDRPLRNAHRSDYADYAPTDGDKCGAARVWQLSTSGWIASDGTQWGGGQFVNKVMWDVDHTYHDMEVYPGFAPGSTYVLCACRKWTDINWTGIGFGETLAGDVCHKGSRTLTDGFPDKNTNLVVYENFSWEAAPLVFPSSGIDRVVLRDGKVNGGLSVGSPKNVLVSNCDIGQWDNTGTTGLSQQIKVENSRIFSVGSSAPQNGLLDGAALNTIDGTNASFVNGVIKLLKSGFPGGYPTWVCVPGCSVAFQAVIGGASIFPGDKATGRVLSITEDATYVKITTDLPFAGVPSWCNGGIWLFKNMEVIFENCTGCDEIRLFSDAHSHGKRYFEYKRYFLGGIVASATNDFFSDLAGELVAISVNVVKASPNSGAALLLDFNTYDTANNYAIDASPSTRISIALDTAGKRTCTQTVKTGFQGADSIAVGGISQTYLPGNRVLGHTWAWSLSNNGVVTNAYDAAKIEITIELDCGSARRPVPVQTANGGATMIAVQGKLP